MTNYKKDKLRDLKRRITWYHQCYHGQDRSQQDQFGDCTKIQEKKYFKNRCRFQ